MKIKVSEATNNQIDWLVAGLRYAKLRYKYGTPVFDKITKRTYETEGLMQIGVSYSPSNNWNIAGPIIERELVNGLHLQGIGGYFIANYYCESLGGFEGSSYGPSPLVAAMRCYIASKMGDEVEIPDDLI